MRAFDQEFRAHIESEATTLCRCWIVHRVDGDRLGFTDHDNDIWVDGVLCEGQAGAEPSAVEEAIGLNTDASEISGALQSNRISATDIVAGKYDMARINSYLVNWENTAQNFLDSVNLIGRITQEDGVFHFELQSLTAMLDQTSGRHFIKRCQAELGDARCKINLQADGFQGHGSVATIKHPHTIQVTGLSGFLSDWFSGGHLTWTSGANAGTSIEISSHQEQGELVTLMLWQPMPHAIEKEDQFSITAGCDKYFATCKSKFQNAKNFQGFPHLPGEKFILSHGSDSENFDGGPIIQ